MKDLVTALLVFSVIALAGVASYQFGTKTATRQLSEVEKDLIIKDVYLLSLGREEKQLTVFQQRIDALQQAIKEKEEEVIEVQAHHEPQLNCLACHDLEQTRSFHSVQRIFAIQEKKNLRIRICVNCHGPPGNSSSPIPNASQPYPSDDSHPHVVHHLKLDAGDMTCGTCHVYNGEYRYPKPKNGQLLVCELCHANGNFITIHIDGKILEDAVMDQKWMKESKKHACTICHMGGVVDIHKRATGKLGQVVS